MHPSTNGTGFVVAIGTLLAFIAGSFGITGVEVVRSIREASTRTGQIGRALGALVLVAVATPAACGAGWLFWTAHRGDYAPWANTRVECRARASEFGLRGSERSSYVSRCVQAAVDYDAE